VRFFLRFSTSSHIFGTEFLQERLTLETSRPDFSSLPFRFAEIAKVILDVLVLSSGPFFLHALTHITSASDDLENPEKLRSLLKDLREARQAKSREGLKTLDHSELSVSCSPVYYLFIDSFYFSCQIFVPWRSTRFGLISFKL